MIGDPQAIPAKTARTIRNFLKEEEEENVGDPSGS